MQRSLVRVAFLVREYDEAIHFFVDKLDFRLVEDRAIPEQNKRWVVVAPRGGAGAELVLGRASTDVQRESVGRQAGDRVAFFLRTDDFWRDYEAMTAAGIQFVEEPRTESYGTVAVFRDLYGNRWDLIEDAS